MWKYLKFPVVLLVCCALNVNAEAPKIFLDREDSAVRIEATGLWKRVESPGFINDANTPSGTLAARLGENGTIFTWKSSTDSSNLSGGADLTALLLSADESMLIFCERIGGAGKNNSSRLVFLNLFSGRICGGFELPMRRITGLTAIPGKPEELLAIQEGQESCGNGNQILKIDLTRKRIIGASMNFEQKIVSLITDGKHVWFSLDNSSRFGELPIGNLRSAVRFHECKGEVLTLCRCNGGAVAAVERGVCEFFTMSHGRLFLNNSIDLPQDFTANWVKPAQNSDNSMIMVDRDGQAIYVSAGGTRHLNGRMEHCGCLLPDQTFMLGSSDRQRLLQLTLPDCSVKGYVAPNSLRPYSRNKNRWIFACTTKPVQLLQVDNRGNVFRVTLTGRRGRKEVILMTDKSGMR